VTPVRRASLAALTLAGVAVAAAAAAQQRRPFPPRPLSVTALEQPTLSFTVSQSLEADTNYDLVDDPGGTTTYGETRFTADYLRDTGTQRLGFGIDTGLRGIDQPREDFEWIAASPSLAYLGYRGEGVDSLLDAEVVARSRVVDSIEALDVIVDPDIDPLDPDPLDQFRSDAREYRYDANLGFTLGTSSPSTWGFRLLATSFDYDETSQNLTPRTTLNPQANWVLRLTPVLSGSLFGGYYYYNADNDADTEIRVAEADAGVIYEPSDVMRLGFGLGYADRRREDTDALGVREETEHETGPVVRADLRYVLPDFTVTGNLRWTTAAAEDNRFSGTIGAFYLLPRGRLFGQVYQRAVGSSAGNEVKVTGTTIGIEHEINTVSRIGLDLAWATQVNLDEDDEPDITRTDLTASYAYDFTAAVSAEVGYQYQTRKEDPIDADSHRVYLLIGRTFETGL
jgi:hypothetical protein